MRDQAYQINGGTVIAINTTQSAAVPYRAYRGGGFATPAALTGTAVTFEVSQDGVGWIALYSASNSPVSITVATSRAYPLPAELYGWHFFRFVSGTTETAARTILYSLKS
jgi:hypothetical protein